VSSNAACTCSGGWTLWTLTLTIRTPVLQAIELRLDRLDEVVGDRVALLVEDRVDLALADDLAHRGFGGERDRRLRIAVLEQERARVPQPVLHGEADVDDVLVLRQHRRIAQAGRLRDRVAADLGRAQLGDVDRLVRLERIREAPLEAGVDGVAVAAERGDDGLLPFLDDEDAAAEPDQDDDAADQRRADAGAPQVGLEVRPAARIAATAVAALGVAAAAEEAAQLAVEVAPELVEVGRPVVAAAVLEQRDARRAGGATATGRATPGGGEPGRAGPADVVQAPVASRFVRQGGQRHGRVVFEEKGSGAREGFQACE
jgi:hypothetical protein